ncbi:MAG: hypothetical protein KTV68_16820 [Acidimicrobiia bacterium]|nr:hypothetical protein [Acidimicrobiia bacterium]
MAKSASVDISRSLEWASIRRREKLEGKIKYECLHLKHIGTSGDRVEVQLSMISPSGTAYFHCTTCGTWMTEDMTYSYQQEWLTLMAGNAKATLEFVRKSRAKVAKLSKKLLRSGGPVKANS